MPTSLILLLGAAVVLLVVLLGRKFYSRPWTKITIVCRPIAGDDSETASAVFRLRRLPSDFQVSGPSSSVEPTVGLYLGLEKEHEILVNVPQSGFFSQTVAIRGGVTQQTAEQIVDRMRPLSPGAD